MVGRMEALVLGLLGWIVSATGYPMPAAPPSVEFVSHACIRDTACAGRECAVGAMYLRARVVYMDDRLDPTGNLYDSAVLLHELAHYVQERSGRFREESCRAWLAEEREAYTLQARWLRERHRRYPLQRQLPPADLCDREEPPAD